VTASRVARLPETLPCPHTVICCFSSSSSTHNMRSSASSHRLSYRTTVSSQPGGSKCLSLDCKSILNLLHVLDANPSQAESSTTVGQKRPRALSHIVSRKRRLFGIEQSVASCPANESIPVLHHEFDLQYSKEHQEVYPYVKLISDNEAEENGLISSEESLVDFLRNICASFTEPITLDCGDVLINSYGEYGGTVDAKLSHLEEQRTGLCGIFVVPSLNSENIESEGHLFSWVDALTRCAVSQPAMEVAAGLRMVILPLTSWDHTLHTLPFRLVVDVVLSFRSPSIIQPPPYLRKGQSRIEIENARRGLLHLAFPPPPLPETLSTSFHGRIDVPFLYSVVQPARELLHESMDKFLQPQVLLPRLLPFQRRTVCWMLSREGKAFGPTGELTPMATDAAELPVLWRRVTVQRADEQLTWYYHRLTGTLTPERPSPRTVLGGILAEEPGLGKTLECIALMLLNPSIERSISPRWDSEANLNIREIRVYPSVLFCLRSLY
jgi:E3 ubiquitin-protein ligase SHPRH